MKPKSVVRYLLPSRYHRLIATSDAATNPSDLAARVWDFIDRARALSATFAVFSAYAPTFAIEAMKSQSELAARLARARIDWCGKTPLGAPTHRLRLFNRQHGADYADIYLQWIEHGDARPGVAVEVRIGDKEQLDGECGLLRATFSALVEAMAPDRAVLETAYATAPIAERPRRAEASWLTFVPDGVDLPALRAPTECHGTSHGSIVVATPGFDDTTINANVRDRLATALLHVLRAPPAALDGAQAETPPPPAAVDDQRPWEGIDDSTTTDLTDLPHAEAAPFPIAEPTDEVASGTGDPTEAPFPLAAPQAEDLKATLDLTKALLNQSPDGTIIIDED